MAWTSVRRVWCLGTLSLALSGAASAGELRLTDAVVAKGPDGDVVEVTVSWVNAWHQARNHDAAWIVLRDAAAPHRSPLRLAATGHRALAGAVPVTIEVSEDQLGVFVSAQAPYRGDVEWRLSLALAAPASAAAVQPFGVEMVLVPDGGFEVGDDHEVAVRFGAVFAAGEGGAPAGPLRIESEAELPVGPDVGALFYEAGGTPQYRGDQQGPVPAAFPKGTRAFYVMKYELRQGEYAAFLNALPEPWCERRANDGIEDEDAESQSIQRTDAGFVAAAPNRPCNFVTWADTCAFADWMALRPMTELEFEKAARGPQRPVPLDYPWGTAEVHRVERQVEPLRDLRHADAEHERALTDETRVALAASHYWVMDLAGSLWERVVSIGHPAGRAFRGSHGDGVLDSETGDATNADWPRQDGEPGTEAAADGIGYRGGAEYFAPRVAENPTNPQSPVALRTFAAWNGAYRYKTYSARACRTAR
ncbi:MAG: SUMF1/EgtB/PvdO family nonheme iron enzyme [Planctomycetota bacterium]